MNQTTSTIEPPKSGVGEGSAKIAVAILTFGEKASVLFCWTCWNVLVAGLRRNSVAVVESMPVYNENWIAAIITIPASQRAAAQASVKATLTELDLLAQSTIAMDRAGESWFTVHGVGVGGIRFEAGFLRPELLDASIAAMQKWNSDRQAIIEALQRSASEQGETPEAP